MLSIEQPISLIEVTLGDGQIPKPFFVPFSTSLGKSHIIPLEGSIALSDSIDKLSLEDSINTLFTSVCFHILNVPSLANGPLGHHHLFHVSFNQRTIRNKRLLHRAPLGNYLFNGKFVIDRFVTLQVVNILIFFRYDKKSIFLLVFIVFVT